jgi:hypothetical protein
MTEPTKEQIEAEIALLNFRILQLKAVLKAMEDTDIITT